MDPFGGHDASARGIVAPCATAGAYTSGGLRKLGGGR